MPKNRSRWLPATSPHARNSLPIAGCYVIYHGEKIIYIGQSCNVRGRMRSHDFENFAGYDEDRGGFTSSPWGNLYWCDGFLTVKIKYAQKYGEHLMLEARLIRRLKPTHNKRGLS